MLRTTTRKATATVAAILIVGGAGAATAAALDDSVPVDIAPPTVQQHTEAPDHPAPYYSAVARSTQKPTARVSEMVDVLADRFPDVAGRRVRGIKAADGTQAWVVSGNKYTCLGADNREGTGYTCSPNGEAFDGVSIAERREDGTQRTIALVPDRIASVSADGADVEPTNNLVITEHRADSAVEAHPADGGSPFRIGTE